MQGPCGMLTPCREWLMMANIPLMLASRVPQIMQNFALGHTGILSLTTLTANFVGSAVRIFTSIEDAKKVIQLQFSVPCVCVRAHRKHPRTPRHFVRRPCLCGSPASMHLSLLFVCLCGPQRGQEEADFGPIFMYGLSAAMNLVLALQCFAFRKRTAEILEQAKAKRD